MSATDPTSKAILIGIAVALAIGVLSGVWVVGAVIGIAVAASLSDRMRRRAVPPAPPMVERGRKKRKSG